MNDKNHIFYEQGTYTEYKKMCIMTSYRKIEYGIGDKINRRWFIKNQLINIILRGRKKLNNEEF